MLGFGIGGVFAFSLGDAMLLGYAFQTALGGGLLGLFLGYGDLSMSSDPSVWILKNEVLRVGFQGVIGGLFLGISWGYCERLSTATTR